MHRVVRARYAVAEVDTGVGLDRQDNVAGAVAGDAQAVVEALTAERVAPHVFAGGRQPGQEHVVVAGAGERTAAEIDLPAEAPGHQDVAVRREREAAGALFVFVAVGADPQQIARGPVLGDERVLGPAGLHRAVAEVGD
ncbi:hypothetical protein [Nannocystis pusilla]|uniref:hypothetical protein n=1 Tax=Nannocystis pusilla TaxID=889268 RepID=UPI003B81DF46